MILFLRRTESHVVHAFSILDLQPQLPPNAMISTTIEIAAPPSKVRSVVRPADLYPPQNVLPLTNPTNHHSSSTSPNSPPTTPASSKPSSPSIPPTPPPPPSHRVTSYAARSARRSSRQSRETSPAALNGRARPITGYCRGCTRSDLRIAK